MFTNHLVTNLLNLINIILFLLSNRENTLVIWRPSIKPKVHTLQRNFSTALKIIPHKKGEIIKLIFGDILTLNGHLLNDILFN